MNKLLLIICEGTSDKVTLYSSTKNYIKKKNITIQPIVTHGDIALKENATTDSCRKEIEKIIKDYKKQYSLFPTDFFGVYHIIDTDGAFVENDVYVSVEKGHYYNETEGVIYANDVENRKAVNKNKREIYEYLLSLKKVQNVDYKVLFFSRNLEHALYNKPNCTEEEKKSLSNEFEEIYGNNEDAFYKVIDDCSFGVPHNYEESWNYIMSNSNSIRRGNNYIALLDMIKQYKK